MLILLDPPIKLLDQKGDPKNSSPYQGGYVDFSAWAVVLREICNSNWTSNGPLISFALNDILYYLVQWCSNSQCPPTPGVPTQIPRRLVLSHYVVLVELTNVIISELEDSLRRRGSNLQALYSLNDPYCELFGWNRRLSEYCEFIEAAIDYLGIPSGQSEYPRKQIIASHHRYEPWRLREPFPHDMPISSSALGYLASPSMAVPQYNHTLLTATVNNKTLVWY